MHHIPGPHMQYMGPMLLYPPVYGAYQNYGAPWMNQFSYQPYHIDPAQYLPHQVDPPQPAAPLEPNYQVPDKIQDKTVKALELLSDGVIAKLNPTRKEGAALSAQITKTLRKVYKPKNPSTDKQLDDVLTSIDLPKEFCLGPIPLTNPPIYASTNKGSQRQDRRFQRMQNLLLTT
jgi:hypothetical protein